MYWNPIARSREESSRFLVSMMIGRFTRWRIFAKSKVRNSGQPVATINASTPLSHTISRFAILDRAVELEFAHRASPLDRRFGRVLRPASRFWASCTEAEPATELVFGLKASPRIPTSLLFTESIAAATFCMSRLARFVFTSRAAFKTLRSTRFSIANPVSESISLSAKMAAHPRARLQAPRSNFLIQPQRQRQADSIGVDMFAQAGNFIDERYLGCPRKRWVASRAQFRCLVIGDQHWHSPHHKRMENLFLETKRLRSTVSPG